MSRFAVDFVCDFHELMRISYVAEVVCVEFGTSRFVGCVVRLIMLNVHCGVVCV